MSGRNPRRVAANTEKRGQYAVTIQQRQKLAKKRQNQARNAELLRMREQWVKEGLVEHGLSPIASLQRIVDDATLRYLAEVHANEQRRAAGERVSDTRERALAREAAYFNTLALQYHIADRQTRVQEQRTALLAELLGAVLRHPDISLPEGKIRKIPALLEQEALRIQERMGSQAVEADGRAAPD